MKYMIFLISPGVKSSLPSRERGLKYQTGSYSFRGLLSLPSRERGLKYICQLLICYCTEVAPFAGAWIEMYLCADIFPQPRSLPSRERGLKCFRMEEDPCTNWSLPSRERGLKCTFVQIFFRNLGRSLRGSVD